MPGVAFVSLYSLLSHKELRFILPAFPLFTAVAAVGLLKLLRQLERQRAAPLLLKRQAAAVWSLSTMPLTVTVVLLLASAAFSLFSLHVSSFNYPGGVALTTFHSVLRQLPSPPSPSSPVGVHLSNLACTTGVTRFLQLDDGSVSYSKEEGLSGAELSSRGWDWLLEESSDAAAGYELVTGGSVDGLQRVDWRRGKLLTAPQLFILKRRADSLTAEAAESAVDIESDDVLYGQSRS